MWNCGWYHHQPLVGQSLESWSWGPPNILHFLLANNQMTPAALIEMAGSVRLVLTETHPVSSVTLGVPGPQYLVRKPHNIGKKYHICWFYSQQLFTNRMMHRTCTFIVCFARVFQRSSEFWILIVYRFSPYRIWFNARGR